MRPFLRAAAFVLGLLPLAAFAGKGVPPGWKTYNNQIAGYAISYPADWKVDVHYVYPGFGPDHDIHGIAFTIPRSMTRHTNLSPNMTGVSVETVNGRGRCNATRFLPDAQELRKLRNAGRTWSTANMQDAGAGNFYDIAVFAVPGSSPCLAVRYTIHSTNIGNYDPGTVREFDKTALVKLFAKVRQSLRLYSDR